MSVAGIVAAIVAWFLSSSSVKLTGADVGRPVHGALVLVPEQCEALPEALPEVLEQRPVNCLQPHDTQPQPARPGTTCCSSAASLPCTVMPNARLTASTHTGTCAV